MGKYDFNLPAILFSVSSTTEKRYYLLENHYICQVPNEEKFLVMMRIKNEIALKEIEKFRNGQVELHTLKECIVPEELPQAIQLWGESIKSKAHAIESSRSNLTNRYFYKFLSSEMNRIFFGGYFNRQKLEVDLERRKYDFLLSIYKEIFGDKNKVELISRVYIPISVDHEKQRVIALNENFSAICNVLNSFSKKKKITISAETLASNDA